MNTTTAAATLSEAIDRRDQAERDIYAAVDDLRAGGATWAAIGTLLGVSRQAAWERYGDSAGTSGND